MNAIEDSHLRRTFTSNIGVIKRSAREIVAVDDVSFEIQEGELFGLLGPNGAGKTTTTKMLTTLLIPTLGSARIQGFDVVKNADQVRRRIGFIFGGERGLYWRLSGIDNLRYFASLYNVDPDDTKKRIAYLLDMVNRYFQRDLGLQDVVWTFAGLRPLLAASQDDPKSVTRDYVLDFDRSGPPLLSIYGGKLTTYRRMAQDAVDLVTDRPCRTARQAGQQEGERA